MYLNFFRFYISVPNFMTVGPVIKNLASLNVGLQGGLIIITTVKYCFNSNSVAFSTILLSLRPFSIF